MKRRLFLPGMFAIALAAGCSGSGGGGVVPHRMTSASQNAPQYSIVELPSLGGSFSIGGAINQQGVVAGGSNLTGDANGHAVIWRANAITDLGTLGGPNSFAQWINDQNAVSVISDTTTPDPFGADFCGFGTGLICRGFVWRGGSVTALPTLGGNNAAPLFGYNNRGQPVGVSENAVHDATCPAPNALQNQAVVWGPNLNQTTVLPPLSGDTNAQAGSINENGDVVGGSGDCTTVYIFGGIHAVLWRHGLATNLGSLGGTYNSAFGINNLDQVIGRSFLPGDAFFHGFLWQNGVMADLGTLPGDVISEAAAINNAGTVAGFSCRTRRGPCSAVIWKNGAIFDLNQLVPATSGLDLRRALGINDAGQITGFAVDVNTGNVVAYLATPTGSTISLSNTRPRADTGSVSPRIGALLRRQSRIMHRELVP